MKTFEFEITAPANGQIAIPADVASQLPSGELVHVVLQWNADSNDDDAWRTMGRERFEAAYAPEDAVYDQLIDETQSR